MAQSGIVVYGAMWCPDCVRAKKFLSEQLVRFRWVDIESDQPARAYVERVNHGKRIIPTIVFEDGSILVEPTNAQLALKLGLQTQAKMSYYDVVVVGAGPAGLTAAMYTAREGMNTLVLERSAPGGQAAGTRRMENFPGFPEGLTGQEFADRMVRQAKQFGAEILQAQQVMRLESRDNHRIVHLDSKSAYNSSAILLATGATYRRLYVPGEEDYIGAGVHFCATCDGPFYKGADHLVVIGGGNTAVEEGIFLTQFANHVTLLVRGDQLSASKLAQDQLAKTPKVQVLYQTVVTGFRGDGKLQSIGVRNLKTGAADTLNPAAVFVLIGTNPNSALVKGMVALDADGYILTGRDLLDPDRGQSPEGNAPQQRRVPHSMETSVRGIFAAGDVRAGSTKQVASAVGEGASAALAIREYLRGK